jgi:hypothetical protein
MRWRHGLIIDDEEADRPVLAFDLEHVLGALGTLALESGWRAQVASWTPRPGLDAEPFAAWGGGEAEVDGGAALGLARTVLRVADGTFEGLRGGAPWIEVSAVDGTHWDVRTDEEAAVAALEGRFRSTRRYTPEW